MSPPHTSTCSVMCVLAESRTRSIDRCNAHTWSLEMPASPLPTSVSCWVSHRLELRASEVDEGEAAAVRDANEVSPAGLTKAQPSSAASRTTTEKSDLIAHFTIVPFETRMESRRVSWLLATTTTATHNATRTLYSDSLAPDKMPAISPQPPLYRNVSGKKCGGIISVDLSCYPLQQTGDLRETLVQEQDRHPRKRQPSHQLQLPHSVWTHSVWCRHVRVQRLCEPPRVWRGRRPR